MFILFAKRLRRLSGESKEASASFEFSPSRKDVKSESENSCASHIKESHTGTGGGSNISRPITKIKKKTDDVMFKLSLKITVLTFVGIVSLLCLVFFVAMGLSPFLVGPLDLCVNGACIFLEFSFSSNVYDKVCWGCSRLCKSLYVRKIAKKKRGNNEDAEKDMEEAIHLGDVEKGKAVE